MRAGRLLITASLFASCIAGAALTACSDDDTATTPSLDAGASADAAGDTGSTEKAGTVQGNATYSGTQQGAIYVALFTSFGPTGPSGLSGVGAVLNPTLPGSNPFKITNVPPGTYFLTGYIAPAVMGQPPDPGPTSAKAAPVMVVVTEGATTSSDIDIVDPAPEDGGLDASDAGDGGG